MYIANSSQPVTGSQQLNNKTIYGGCGNAVLSGTCFGYDAAFAHTACQQNLPDGIVDFVCAGMIQVFPFQVNPATVLFRQTPCLVLTVSGRGDKDVETYLMYKE